MSYSRKHLLTMYRHIFKHGRFYPSINRPQILASVSEFFHDSKNVTAPEELTERLKIAEMILGNFRMYHAKVIELRTGTIVNCPFASETVLSSNSKDFIYS